MSDATQVFAALADETRLRIVNLLSRGELCVCDIVEILDAPQSTISRHLATLRHAGLVRSRRQGTWMHYSLTEAETPLRRMLAEWLRDAGDEVPDGSADLDTLARLLRCGELCTPHCAEVEAGTSTARSAMERL